MSALTDVRYAAQQLRIAYANPFRMQINGGAMREAMAALERAEESLALREAGDKVVADIDACCPLGKDAKDCDCFN